MQKQNFKNCTLCGKIWESKEKFLNDDSLNFNGHMINTKKIRLGLRQEGLLIFTHHTDHCGTSLAIPASLFKDNI